MKKTILESKVVLRLILFVVLVLLTAPIVQAGSVLVTIPDLIGSRDSSSVGGIELPNGWANDASDGNGFQIAWKIADTGAHYSYQYTITGLAQSNLSKGLSHINIQISDDIEDIDNPDVFKNTFWAFTTTENGSSASVKKEGPSDLLITSGNPLMPSNLYGIKWETGEGDVLQYKIKFNSSQAPVWGDFYAKDGKTTGTPKKNIVAYNMGFGVDVTGTDYTNWIPTPDTIGYSPPPLVPLPAAVWPGLILIGGLLARYRNRS